MNYSEMSSADLVAELKTAGKNPDINLLNCLIKAHGDLNPSILNRFRQIVANYQLNKLPLDEPERYEGILLSRLCIERGLEQAIPIMGELYRQSWEGDVTIDGLGREPAQFGQPAIPIFSAVLAMNTLGQWHNGKSATISILTDMALLYPNLAGNIKEVLRSGLPKLNENGGISQPKDEMWGEIAIALGKLQDKESYNQIIAMIRQGVTDSDVVSRERYEKFYTGESTPRRPTPFSLAKVYESSLQFEEMLAGMGDKPEQEAPSHAHDMVARAKRMEEQRKRSAKTQGRNEPCACGSGKKYKNCCGKK